MNDTPWYFEKLPYEITLGRDYYGRSMEIVDWLRANIGDGVVIGYIRDGSQDSARWSYDQIFGHTFLRFASEADLA